MKPVKLILNLFLIVVTGLLFTTQVRAACFLEDPQGDLNVADDWVINPNNRVCGGFYQEKPLPFPNQTVITLPNQAITITSERGQFLPEDMGPSTLQGEVHLIQGNRQVFGDLAEIYRSSRTGKVETIRVLGGVSIYEPGLRLQGSQGLVFVTDETKKIEDAQYRLYGRHARGTAKCAKTFGKDLMILEDATYTTCAPGQNTWHLKAEKVTLNKISGRGQATHARMYIKNWPLFYLPYIDFPIDNRRQTGFLYPVFPFTSRSGLELNAPFYWNIAPNFDMTLTPRYLSRRNFELQTETRYLTRNSWGEIQVAVLPHDRAYQKFRIKNLENPKFPNNDPRVSALRRGGNDRRSLFYDHHTIFNRHVTSNWHYQKVGDANYFYDLGNRLNVANTTQLLQQADIAYNDLNWMSLARVQAYQTLHPYEGPVTSSPYRRLPQLAVQNIFPDLPYGFVWTTESEYDHFTHKINPFTGFRPTIGDRYQLRPGISYPIVTPGWFLKPRLQWNFQAYSLRLAPHERHLKFPSSPHLELPIFDFDSGLIFEKPICLCNEDYLQTLEPRAYYVWVPFRNQNRLPNFDSSYSGFDYNQLFRYNRFSGLDRVGDTNQVTLALSTRFLRARSGSERASLTLGQIFYFKDRKVTVCNPLFDRCCLKREMPDHNKRRSNYVGVGKYHLQDSLTANASLQWNPYASRLDERLVWLQYQPDELNVVNFGYLFLRRNPAQLDPVTGLPIKLEQTDFSFAWTLNENWRFLARHQYDLRSNRTNQILAGIEQQGCCTAVRLTVIQYLLPLDPKQDRRRYANGIYFQFVFKGFAGVGHNNLNTTLARSIPGYAWPGDRY